MHPSNSTANFPVYFRLFPLFLVLFLTVHPLQAKEVRLQPGESFRQGDLSVTCGDTGGEVGTLELRECQFWDDFKKTCLFEKIIFVYNNLQCVEECRHWDSFNNVCHYQTRCVFHPGQQAFVLTDCSEFDDFSKKCVKTREKVIGRAGMGR